MGDIKKKLQIEVDVDRLKSNFDNLTGQVSKGFSRLRDFNKKDIDAYSKYFKEASDKVIHYEGRKREKYLQSVKTLRQYTEETKRLSQSIQDTYKKREEALQRVKSIQDSVGSKTGVSKRSVFEESRRFQEHFANLSMEEEGGGRGGPIVIGRGGGSRGAGVFMRGGRTLGAATLALLGYQGIRGMTGLAERSEDLQTEFARMSKRMEIVDKQWDILFANIQDSRKAHGFNNKEIMKSVSSFQELSRVSDLKLIPAFEKIPESARYSGMPLEALANQIGELIRLGAVRPGDTGVFSSRMLRAGERSSFGGYKEGMHESLSGLSMLVDQVGSSRPGDLSDVALRYKALQNVMFRSGLPGLMGERGAGLIMQGNQALLSNQDPASQHLTYRALGAKSLPDYLEKIHSMDPENVLKVLKEINRPEEYGGVSEGMRSIIARQTLNYSPEQFRALSSISEKEVNDEYNAIAAEQGEVLDDLSRRYIDSSGDYKEMGDSIDYANSKLRSFGDGLGSIIDELKIKIASGFDEALDYQQKSRGRFIDREKMKPQGSAGSP